MYHVLEEPKSPEQEQPSAVGLGELQTDVSYTGCCTILYVYIHIILQYSENSIMVLMTYFMFMQ